MEKPSKKFVYDFIILSLRWYLAFYMIDYGWAKINGDQFGVYDQTILEKPLKDVDKFFIAWHLFSLDKTFDLCLGFLQIMGALLIIFNRTNLIGALFLLPILVQIFLIDVSFTMNIFGLALPFRIAGMILADLTILLYHKNKIHLAWISLTEGTATKYNYKWWVFVFMPFIGFATDFVIGLLTYPIRLLIDFLLK